MNSMDILIGLEMEIHLGIQQELQPAAVKLILKVMVELVYFIALLSRIKYFIAI